MEFEDAAVYALEEPTADRQADQPPGELSPSTRTN
jgi:hypothetical protein